MSTSSNDPIDWRKVERFYIELLLDDPYDQHSAEELGFVIAQILEDSKPLIDHAQTDGKKVNIDREQIMEDLHMFFNNVRSFEKGAKLLMRETTT